MTLAQLLAQQGTTQAQLARTLNLPRQYVGNWNAGSHRPSPEVIATIAAHLKVSTDDVYAALGTIPPDLAQSIIDHAPASFATIRKELM